MSKYSRFKRLTARFERPLLMVTIITGNLFILLTINPLQIVCLITFLFLAVRTIPTVFKAAKEQYHILRRVNWNIKIPEVLNIANIMGVKLDAKKPIGSVPDFFNATVTLKRNNNQIIIGQPILNMFNTNQITGIIAHELSHIKNLNARLKFFIISIIVISILSFPYARVFPLRNELSLDLLVLYVILLATWLEIFSIFQWYFEYSADILASKYTGDDITSALNKFTEIVDKDEISLTHPSISQRIRKLTKAA